MIAPEHNDGVFIQAERVDFVQDAPNLRIHKTDAGGIAMLQLSAVFRIFQKIFRMMDIPAAKITTGAL